MEGYKFLGRIIVGVFRHVGLLVVSDAVLCSVGVWNLSLAQAAGSIRMSFSVLNTSVDWAVLMLGCSASGPVCDYIGRSWTPGDASPVREVLPLS